MIPVRSDRPLDFNLTNTEYMSNVAISRGKMIGKQKLP